MAEILIPTNLRDTARFRRVLRAWYRDHRRDLPWRRTRDPYAILVAEVLLQQTRVEQAIGYYARFLEAFPDLETLARASEEDVLRIWAGAGYYRRARGAGEGDEVFLFFRPEWVELGEGPFVAEVEGAEYLGDRWELRARFRDLPLVLVTSRDLRSNRELPFALSNAQAIPR